MRPRCPHAAELDGMTPGRRSFLEAMIARLEPRAARHRIAGGPGSAIIADVLERMIARDRADLVAAPAPPAPPAPSPPIAPVEADIITWRSPVFNAGGRFNPFAGTWRDAMLASAATCDKLGEHVVAAGYRELATTALADGSRPPEISQVRDREPAQLSRVGRRSAPVWDGPPLPPPEPAPFTAGEQMGFAL